MGAGDAAGDGAVARSERLAEVCREPAVLAAVLTAEADRSVAVVRLPDGLAAGLVEEFAEEFAEVLVEERLVDRPVVLSGLAVPAAVDS